ncbi:Transposon Ty3-I Gag-Pol polyprotein [Vitis vinifera]|uniref:Transposon Ty3-I Gag-Pol polyprotein n=1 Tax=Vitis vinifera TaxID=29760 RepID=A0A438GSQ7_VITVI|nr:Transposon Ty3-I Gag-Pol polyprotein [Vitis vinifera]
MDAVLQIFKRSICPGTSFFESLAKKPPTTMDYLFQGASTYSMLEDDVRSSHPTNLGGLDPQNGPIQKDHSKKCAYHKEHGHTTETCRSLHYLVEKLIRAGHLKQYLRSDARVRDTSRNHNSGTSGSPPPQNITTTPRCPHPVPGDGRLRRETHPSRPGQLDRSFTSIGNQPHGTRSNRPRNPRRILSGFNGAVTISLGDIVLLVQAGPVTLNVQFSVVQDLSPFNVILGRTWLYYMKVIPSTYHQIVSFLTEDGQIDLYGSQLTARQMLSDSTRNLPAADPLRTIQISEESTHFTYISSLLTPEETRNIQDTLRQNHDVFAWAHYDMKGMHPSIVSHRLNVLPTAKPVRQKVRRFHPDRQKIIRDEVDKLLEAGFIREVEYPDWLTNVVVVPKKKGKWRVCVDYTNLNNAYPKDSFPLPRIDQIVDSTAGQGMLSFLDAFSGYHQIPMAPTNEEKTAFITPHGLYCYKVMPFGLKNIGATYQKLMTKIFKPLVGRTVEVYIDDIVVKSKTREEHALHLQEVFHLLGKYDMKLNPSKCVFGVSTGKFLGFMVSQRGIEVSRDQVKGKNKVFKDGANSFDPSKFAQNLPSYFQAHPMVVLTDQPLRNILHKPNLTRRMLQWAIRVERIWNSPWLYLSQAPVYSDSQLVVRHVQKEYEAKDERMTRYLTKVRDTLQRFTEWMIEKIKRTENGRADALAGIKPLHSHQRSHIIAYTCANNPFVAEASACNTIKANQANAQEWTEDIIRYLRTGTLPEEPKQAHKTRVQATRFTLIRGTCISGPLQALSQVPKPLKSLVCMPHTACAVGDVKTNFAQWGMDIVGPLPAAAAQKKFLIVATDYFSKWVEAEAYASIKDKDVTKFVWKNIICRFGIPQTIIADNGPQFDSITFRNFYLELNIRNLYSTPRYPQSNGQAEVTNKTLITALKKRLEQAKGKWAEELPGVLWAYRTTPGRPT